MSNEQPQAEQNGDEPAKPKYAKGSFPAMLGNTRIADTTQPGRATVFMGSPASLPAEEPKPERTPEQRQFVADMERLEGRKFTEQEATMWIRQAEQIGDL
jgi:hypothetical protein